MSTLLTYFVLVIGLNGNRIKGFPLFLALSGFSGKLVF